MTTPPTEKGRGSAPGFPKEILLGVQSRLIPDDIPVRFFLAAMVFHVVAWGLLILGHSEVAEYVGGPGVVLSAIHALTLGVLAMVALGASYQVLSVVTGVTIKSHFLYRLSSWLYIPGSVLMVVGMMSGESILILAGGGFVTSGLTVYVALIAITLLRARALNSVAQFLWAAMACLVLLVAAGITLAVDLEFGILASTSLFDHFSLAIVHAVVAGYGFIGFLVIGFSHLLVPMFALSSLPSPKLSSFSLTLLLTGMAFVVIGLIGGNEIHVIVGGGIGISGVFVHLWLMVRSLRTGMKKRLGLSFVLVRTSWILLPLSIVIGSAAPSISDDTRFIVMFGFLLFFGWLLTFLTGILQRILPFLASMHAHHVGHRAPRLSAIGHQAITLKTHGVCHLVAVFSVAAGIATSTEPLVLVGGISGFTGALALLWFAVAVCWHITRYYKKTENQNPVTEKN